MSTPKKPKTITDSLGRTRNGGGMPPGHVTAKTISKELAREEARAYIQKQMPRMLKAQIEASCGVAHLLIRDDEGKFSRAPADMTEAEMLAVLNGDSNRYYIAVKDPNTQAFNTLAAYALDKPKEQAQEVNLNVTELGAKLDAARELARQRNAKKP